MPHAFNIWTIVSFLIIFVTITMLVIGWIRHGERGDGLLFMRIVLLTKELAFAGHAWTLRDSDFGAFFCLGLSGLFILFIKDYGK